MHPLFTIGHSAHPLDKFITLLSIHGVTAVCDVRSSPYSRLHPQFNRENVKPALLQKGISYVYLGKELGPRSEDPSCYVDGRVRYELLSEKSEFREGLDRIRKGLNAYRIALMCAEKDPVTCHRFILVCRHLRAEGMEILHILADGSLEAHGDAERRLLRLLKIPELQLFETPENLIEKAYDLQGEKIAYVLRASEEDPDTNTETEFQEVP